MATLVGIDLGGRTTGRTAVSVLKGGQLSVYGTAEVHARSADHPNAFTDFLLELEADVIGVDAPLSLPDVTQADYLRRPGDRALGALSPFTLGELTARALHLHHAYRSVRPHTAWVEVYPKTVAGLLLGSARGYKRSAALQQTLAEGIIERYGWALPRPYPTDDALDSVLALVAVWHYHTGAYRDHSTTEVPFIEPI